MGTLTASDGSRAHPPAAEGGRIVLGDAADVARALVKEGLRGEVDLIYLDPPYASGVDYTHEERIEGRANGTVARAAAYRDRWEDGAASYLDMLYPRLLAIRPLLRPTGSIWVQVDWRANYLVRMLCDEIFGRERFLNEIVWRRAPNLGRQACAGQFGRTLDTIIVYGGGRDSRLVPPTQLMPVRGGSPKKDPATGRYFTVAPRGDYTDDSVARLEREGRIHRTKSGNVYVKYWLEHDAEGRLCKRQPVDALWADIAPLRHVSPEERTGYPTQKPRALLERIIAAACPDVGLVVDLFAGSGTTGEAAATLGRSFILGDSSPVAIGIMRSRFVRQTTPTLIQTCGARWAARSGAASLQATAVDQGRSRIELACPAMDELLSWSIDPAPEPDAPFRPAWHGIRPPGRHPTPIPTVAELPGLSPGARIEARLQFVDGSLCQIETTVRHSPCRDEAAQDKGHTP